MLLDLMIFLKKHYMIYIIIYSAYFISAWCFQSMTVGTDGGGGRPGICCPNFFASVTLMSTQLFYFKSRSRGERLKAGGEGDNRGWDGWMASLTQWTWVWWTGKPGMLQYMESQRVRHDWVTELTALVTRLYHRIWQKWLFCDFWDYVRKTMQGFPGGPEVKNAPCNARDIVWPLVREESTGHRATKPLYHKYWAWLQQPLKSERPEACALQREKPLQWETRAPQWKQPPFAATRESPHAARKTHHRPNK